MALRRLIACCLGIAAGGLLMLGCGSGGDSTSADIDPAIAADFTNKLAVINAYAAEGDCDRAKQALGTLMTAVDLESGQTGDQFTSDLQDLLGQLEGQLQDQCQPIEETSSTTTEATDTAPATDDTEQTSTSTTTATTTTKDTTTTTPPPAPPTSPGNSNGNGNGPPSTPGGGISPTGKKKERKAQIKKPKRDKQHKRDKHKEQGR